MLQNRRLLARSSNFFSTLRPRLAAAEWLVIPHAGQKLESTGNLFLQRKQVFDFGTLVSLRKMKLIA